MANEQNLIPFKKGQSGNPAGRTKGTKNRSTIVKDIFNSISVLDAFKFDDLKAKFPHIENNMSIEYLMTLIQVNKAIFDADTKAYKVLMDSLYGTPIRQIDLEAQIKSEQDIENNTIKKDDFDLSRLTVEELEILLKAFGSNDEIES